MSVMVWIGLVVVVIYVVYYSHTMTTGANMSIPKRCRTIEAPEPEHRYLRIAEAAAYLGSTEWFIRTLTWKKAIPFTILGKRHVFDRVDLDAYMQNLKVGTA